MRQNILTWMASGKVYYNMRGLLDSMVFMLLFSWRWSACHHLQSSRRHPGGHLVRRSPLQSPLVPVPPHLWYPFKAQEDHLAHWIQGSSGQSSAKLKNPISAAMHRERNNIFIGFSFGVSSQFFWPRSVDGHSCSAMSIVWPLIVLLW